MPRLDRGIQYAAASPLNHRRLGVLDRPVKPGDDGGVLGDSHAFGHMADTQPPARPKTALTFAQIATT